MKEITGNGAAIVPDTFCCFPVIPELNINYKLRSGCCMQLKLIVLRLNALV